MPFPTDELCLPKLRADLLEAEGFAKRVKDGERILVIVRQHEGDRPTVRAARSPAEAIQWCKAALSSGAADARWLWAESVNRQPFTSGS